MRLILLLAAVCGLAFLLPPADALNQIVNGSFEDGVVGFWQDPRDQPLPPPWNKWDARADGHSLGNWNINVDGHDNVPPTSPPDGEHCASVCAGMNQNSGGIWQAVDVTPGLTFYLSGSFYAGNAWNASTVVASQFWLLNGAPTFHPTSGDLITTGGVPALDYTGPRTASWTTFYGGGLTAAGDTIFVVSRFKVTDPWAAYGMHMDNLVLSSVPLGESVPEPGSAGAIFALSGLLMCAVRRARLSRIGRAGH